MIRLRILAFFCGLLLAMPLALGGPAVEAVSHVAIPVAQLDRAVSFYEALGFVQEDDRAAGVGNARMRLGREHIVLRQAWGAPGSGRVPQQRSVVPAPRDRRVRHRPGLRIALRAGASPISAGPQLLPAWNPDAGGIRAVYFRDPDRHPLELIQYPPGKGDPRWQERDRLFLGIDHTAIASSDTERSLAFYRDRLGLRIVGRARTGASNKSACRACRARMSASRPCAPRAAPASNCCTIWPPATATRPPRHEPGRSMGRGDRIARR